MRRIVLFMLTAATLATVGGSPVGARPTTPSTREGTAVLAAPLPLPATELPSAAVASLGTGRTDLFERSAGGTLTHRYRLAPGGPWTAPVDLSGSLASQPAAVSSLPGHLDVFARGTDDTLVHRRFADGRWGSWESLGGILTSAPAAVSWGPDRLDVFVRGGDNALYHKWFVTGRGWSGWERLGGVLTSSPTVTSWATGRLDVFARGGRNEIFHKWFDGTEAHAWHGWEPTFVNATSQPAAASPTGDKRIDLFVRSVDGSMWIKSFSRSNGWSLWRSMRGGFVSGPGAVEMGPAVRTVGRSPHGFVYEAVRPRPQTSWGWWIRIA